MFNVIDSEINSFALNIRQNGRAWKCKSEINLFNSNGHRTMLDKNFTQIGYADGGKLDHNLTGVYVIFMIN